MTGIQATDARLNDRLTNHLPLITGQFGFTQRAKSQFP